MPIDAAFKEFARRVVVAAMRGAVAETQAQAADGAERVLGRAQNLTEAALETIRATRDVLQQRRAAGGGGR